MACCKTCGKRLAYDEIAVTKKLINRGAVDFLCVDCLARHFEVTAAEIYQRIEYFKAIGCTLFDQSSSPETNV